MRPHAHSILVLIIACAVSTCLCAGELVDDFSTGDWRPSNAKAPSTVEAKAGSLLLTDLPGGQVTWGSSCAKRYPEVDLAETPYLVIKVVSLTGAYGAKLSGGKQWPKKTVASGDKPGLVVIDILKTTGWKTGKGPLTVILYTHGDASRAEYGFIKFTDTLSVEERAAVRKQAAAAPGTSAPKHAGLTALAARRGMKPMAVDPKTGERTVYTDPVTGHTIWRMTDDPAVERHVYYDIPAWNANGSLLHWISRRAGGTAWLMDADGTNLRPVPEAKDGGMVRSPHWSLKHPNLMYFARAGETETVIHSLDVRDGTVRKVASVPVPGTIGERRFNEFPPPHPDERHFLLRWGGQDRHASLLVVVDAETGTFWKLEPGMPTHRVRFTRAPDKSIFINSNQDPDKPGEKARSEWVLALDGSKRRLPPGGGHPDWAPNGKWLAAYKDGGIWLVSHNGAIRRELVRTGAGGHGGFSITTGHWHVGDSPRRGPYADLVYVTELETGLVIPIAYHGSSYSGWSSGVPDPEATHPAPVCSPDETKIVYDSDLLGQPDVWVAVWRLPAAPREVRFADGALSWKTPARHRETAGYNLYRKEGADWVPIGKRMSETKATGLDAGTYAVTAQEWSGLESRLAIANSQILTRDGLAPDRPDTPKMAEAGMDYIRMNLPPTTAADFSHYNVYAAENALTSPSTATLVGSPRHRRFVDWGLQPGMKRFYRVTVVDRQGNESLPGPTAAAATEGTPMTPVAIEIEAESGAIEAPMVVARDPAASGGAYVHVPTDHSDEAYVLKGQVTFTFALSQDGIYTVWGRTMGLDGESNSFFVAFDDGQSALWSVPAPRRGPGQFSWQRVPGLHGAALRKGKHRIAVKSREDGTRLDRLIITNNFDFKPQD
ncbi:MAG: hypothetical protein KAI66_25490 [Lentisphaeria bacterium]|nr:hypothetical protein [Lentisphaeria bacterium]